MRRLLMVLLIGSCGDVVKATEADPVCGNSVVEADEECDSGGESAGCNEDCTRASCGDGMVNATAGEQCDDGNRVDVDTCNNACENVVVLNPFASTGEEGAFAPTADVALDAGVHNFTTINIPAGVTVTALGSGLLDLRASGDITIAGTLDVSGGDGGAGTNAAGGNCYGTGGSGGSTATRQAGAAGTTECSTAGGGGTGQVGGTANGLCVAPGGNFGGGAGGGVCSPGGGGGGYAGGGGGGGYINGQGTGGAGATSYGVIASAGGFYDGTQTGATNTAGRGGPGLEAYAGKDGTYVSCGSNGGSPGGGGAIGRFASIDLAVRDSFYPGSGGGGGGGQCNQCYFGSGGGGGGGGALRIASETSVVVDATARLVANGGNGGAGYNFAGTTGGGGGSGGVIYVAAPTVTVAAGAVVSAVGGTGGLSSSAACGKGGDGGLGRIRLSVGASCTLGGTFTPALANACTPSTTAEKVYIATYPN